MKQFIGLVPVTAYSIWSVARLKTMVKVVVSCDL